MPNKRIAMRKIHEILRQRFDFCRISQCADVSTGAIQKMGRADDFLDSQEINNVYRSRTAPRN